MKAWAVIVLSVVVPATAAEHPYREALAAYAEMPSTDLKALQSAAPISLAGAANMERILSSLARGQADTNDWRTEAPAYVFWPQSMASNRLARDLLAYASTAGPDRVEEVAVALLAFARATGRGRSLGDWMAGMAIERKTIEWTTARLASLTPAQAAALRTAYDRLPVGGTYVEALGEEMRWQDAALAEIDRLLATSPDDSAPDIGPLRLSGLVVEGNEPSVGLELADGSSVWLRRGETRGDLALVSIDPAARSALLVRDRTLLRLDLTARRVAQASSEEVSKRWEAWPADSLLRKMLSPDATPTPESLAEVADILTATRHLLADLRKDPDLARDAKRYAARLAEMTPRQRELAPVFIAKDAESFERLQRQRLAFAAALAARAAGKQPHFQLSP
jgi:hypothetical protein